MSQRGPCAAAPTAPWGWGASQGPQKGGGNAGGAQHPTPMLRPTVLPGYYPQHRSQPLPIPEAPGRCREGAPAVPPALARPRALPPRAADGQSQTFTSALRRFIAHGKSRAQQLRRRLPGCRGDQVSGPETPEAGLAGLCWPGPPRLLARVRLMLANSKSPRHQPDKAGDSNVTGNEITRAWCSGRQRLRRIS